MMKPIILSQETHYFSYEEREEKNIVWIKLCLNLPSNAKVRNWITNQFLEVFQRRGQTKKNGLFHVYKSCFRFAYPLKSLGGDLPFKSLKC